MQQSTHSKGQIIAGLIFAITVLIFLMFAQPSYGQSTTVSATVVDQSSTPWANGTFNLDFVPNPNASGNVFWNGNPFPTSQWHHQGILDNSGAFSISNIPSNNFITPSGSTYTISVCPNASAPCSVITNVIISGATLDLSSTITASTPAPKVLPLPLARAYNDAELHVNQSMVGYFYMRVTDSQPRYWGQDGVWHSFGGTLNGFQAGNLAPLFTTTIGSDPTQPNLQFTKINVAPLLVYANCATTTANPLFCAITAQMLPSSISSNTTGSAGSLSGALNQCGNSPTQLFGIGIQANGNENCTQVLFPAVGGNIAVSQMDNGTNADSSHYWTGNGHWTQIPPHNVVVVARANFTSCAMVSAGSTDQNCVATQAWGTTISGAYSISCIIGTPFTGPSGTPDTTGLTQTTWGLSGASPMGTTSFNYYIANQHSAAAGNSVTMSCVAVQ